MALVMEVRIPSCCATKVALFAQHQEADPALCIPWLVTAGLYWYYVLMGNEDPRTIQQLCDSLSEILSDEIERVIC